MCWRRTERARELEDAGHVQVAADPADGHSCLVTLTPAGARRAAAAGLGRPGPVRLFVADWQPGDVRMLTALLDKLRNSIATPKQRASGRTLPGVTELPFGYGTKGHENRPGITSDRRILHALAQGPTNSPPQHGRSTRGGPRR